MKAHHLNPSRRDFLAMSALGLLGLSSRASGALAATPQPDGELLYVGTYTDAGRDQGIYLLRMDSRSGALRQVGSMNAGANPSFLAIHPTGRALYAVNEVMQRNGKPSGGVSSFRIASDTGALTLLNEMASEGGAPCYVSVDRKGLVILVANYVGGNIALLPIDDDGSLGGATHVVQHRGAVQAANSVRQQAAHAHCVIADPSNRFVLAADLGVDRVMVYRLDLSDGTLHHVEGDAQIRSGSGPRHLVFHPSLPVVYVANELNSSVTKLRFDADQGSLSTGETSSTLPEGYMGTSYVADIHIAPSGRTLYVSNRGHNSIAVFSVAPSTGALKLEQVVASGGDWPRNFSLDPTGRWLLVANQRSGNIVVLARDPDSGRLTPTQQRIAIPSPACVRFRAHVGVVS